MLSHFVESIQYKDVPHSLSIHGQSYKLEGLIAYKDYRLSTTECIAQIPQSTNVMHYIATIFDKNLVYEIDDIKVATEICSPQKRVSPSLIVYTSQKE